MDAEICETCGLRWGGIGSHPPCLELPKDERQALVAEAVRRSADQDSHRDGRREAGVRRAQRAFDERAAPLRERLVTECDRLLVLAT
jgi:hypothetical protein